MENNTTAATIDTNKAKAEENQNETNKTQHKPHTQDTDKNDTVPPITTNVANNDDMFDIGDDDDD